MSPHAAPLFGDGFAQRALVEAVLVAALCGLVGVHVVLRRLSFFAMAMTHATFPGVVLAALLGVNLVAGAGLFGILVVLAVAWLRSRPGADQTSVIGVVLSAGFALGVVLLSAQAGFSKDLSAFLVGSVLTVSRSDILTTAAVLTAVALVLAAISKELALGAFDPGTLVAQGYPARLLDIVLLLLIEATIVAAVPSVGTVLSIALIAAPAATARLWTDRLGPMTAVAVALGVLAGLVGMTVSHVANVAAGAAVALVAVTSFVLSWLVAPTHGALARWRAGRRPTGTAVSAAAAVPVSAAGAGSALAGGPADRQRFQQVGRGNRGGTA